MSDRLVEELKQLCDGSCQVGYVNDPYPDCIFCRARARVVELEAAAGIHLAALVQNVGPADPPTDET